MKYSLIGLSLLFGATQMHAQNSCSTAQNIGPGTYSVSAVDGPEAPTPICINTGVASAAEWYKYTPTQDTAVVLTTDLPGSGDTRFHVYSGNCGALVCVAGDDDSGNGLTSRAVFNVTAGTTYRIAFDNNWTSAGFTFQLIEVQPVEPVEGMVTFSATFIPGLSGGDCVVDMNGDHLDDVVRANSTNINIQYQLAGGGFNSVNIPTSQADHSPSWSIVAGDIDGNGYNDLMYGGGQGVTFMMANATGTAFTEVSYAQYIFSQRTNMIDINNDGHLDAFVCHDVDANVAFYNDGEGNLTFVQGGLGETCGNYGSIWVDYDNDGDMDMFVAKCGCDPTDLLMRNNGDGTFTNVAPQLGMSDSHQSWSSAWGDFDNDGDMDILIGASSSSVHKLMRNNGDGTFTNTTEGSGISTGGQSNDWCTHDFNNDGYLDVLSGSGMMFYGNGALGFTANPGNPGSSGIGDFNADGFLDIIGWSGAFLNNGNDNNWLKVNTVGTTSNTNGIGARVRITSAMGSQIREVRSGDAFSPMSSLTTHFGLGQNTVVDEIQIRWPSGIITTMNDVPANTTVTVVESVTTEVSDAQDRALRVYPNPTEEVLYIDLPTALGQRTVSVLDVTGKQVIAPVLWTGALDVSTLAKGAYVVQIAQEGELLQSSFVKH